MRIIGMSFVAAVLLLSSVCLGQQLYDGNQNLPPFGSYHGSDFDVVALQNGNLHIKIPLISVAQRGKTLSWSYIFNTQHWLREFFPQPTPTNPKAGTWEILEDTDYGNGWNLSTPYSWGASSPATTVSCSTGTTAWENYTAIDPEGAKHPLPLIVGACVTNNTAGPAWDGSGMWAVASSFSSIALTLKDGTKVGATREDSNGNLATASQDTLNRSPLTTTNGPIVTMTTPLGSSTNGIQYVLFNTTDSNGNSAVYRVDNEAIDSHTNYCTHTINPCVESTGPLVVPQQLTLPKWPEVSVYLRQQQRCGASADRASDWWFHFVHIYAVVHDPTECADFNLDSGL